MFHRILVPLDGSRHAEPALSLALQLVERNQGSLVLVRAVSPEAGDHVVRSVHDYLHRRATEIEAIGPVETAVLISSDPAEGIVAAANKYAADLIVMVTHARTGPDLLVRGSVADRVIRASARPVLLLTADATDIGELPSRPTILVPLDGSAWSEAALPVAREFARELSGELLLVRAVMPPHLLFEVAAMAPVDFSADLNALCDEAAAYLQRVARRLRAEGVAVRWLVETAPPSAAVVEAEHQARPALVVMATHARDRLGRLLYGSVTASVVHNGRVPVVAVTPHSARRETRHGSEAVVVP